VEEEVIIYLLMFVIPILLISFLYFAISFYSASNARQKMIKTLADDTNKLISEKPKHNIGFSEESNFLKKNLMFAGFTQKSALSVFILISLSFGILCAAFISFVFNSPLILVVSAIVFSFFPVLVLKKIVASRLEEFNFGLKAIIDKTVSMMRSGVGFEQAFKKSILTSRSRFTKEVLDIYIQEKDIVGDEKCFAKMFKMVDSKELRIFYLVMSIGKSSGGKFSNTLETLRETLNSQGTIKNEITSSTKEIKIGSYVIIGITIGIYYLLNTSFDGALNEHFLESKNGQIQLFFIIVWVSFGVFLNGMLTKIKV
jgi:tight adherence protein B